MQKHQRIEQRVRQDLQNQIKKYLAEGGQIEQVPYGKSVPVDATNNWPTGFYNDDNVTFSKKVPRPRP